MNTHSRREILRLIEELGDTFPDVRLGQLIANLSYLAKGPTNAAIWEVEDDELLAAAREQLASRQAPSTTATS